MRRHEAQLDARDLPQEARPDEQPEVPANEQELENGQAHAAKPPAGQRRLESPARRHAVPAREVGLCRPPDESDPDDVDERDQQNFRRDRVSQADRRSDGRIEPGPRCVRDQATLHELPHHQTHPLMDDQLRQDQQRQREQQARVHLHVEEERQPDTAPRVPFRNRQRQQRSPGQQCHHDEAAPNQLQPVPGQTRPAPELIQRPAEDQREVLRILQGALVGPGLTSAHSVRLLVTEATCGRAGRDKATRSLRHRYGPPAGPFAVRCRRPGGPPRSRDGARSPKRFRRHECRNRGPARGVRPAGPEAPPVCNRSCRPPPRSQRRSSRPRERE